MFNCLIGELSVDTLRATSRRATSRRTMVTNGIKIANGLIINRLCVCVCVCVLHK